MSDCRWRIDPRAPLNDEPEYEIQGCLERDGLGFQQGIELPGHLIEEFFYARDLWVNVQIALREIVERRRCSVSEK